MQTRRRVARLSSLLPPEADPVHDLSEPRLGADVREQRIPLEPFRPPVAGAASAHACLWAVSGDAVHRDSALEHLSRSRKLAGSDNPTYLEYEGRILYRIDSREIITRAEYQRRFPGGYKTKGAPR